MNILIFIHLLLFLVVKVEFVECKGADDIPDMVNKMLKNELLYDVDGNLTIVQRNQEGGVSTDVEIFFKEKLIDCDEALGINGLYFDIVVCLLGDSGTCKNGLSICYESSLTEDRVNDKKYMMPTINNEYNCYDKKYHYLHVSIESGKEANIYTSIDENVYKVTLPEVMAENGANCFKIKVGTPQSIATVITDLADQPIPVQPPLPSLQGDFMKIGWGQSRNNFHLFLLDFIPKRNKWLKNYGDYYKTFVYQGSEEICKLTMQFTGEKLQQCASLWVETGYMCPGPYLKTKGKSKNYECKDSVVNVNGSKANHDEKQHLPNICKLSISKTEENRHSRLVRNILTTGKGSETEDYKKVTIFPYGAEREFKKWNQLHRHKKIYKVENVNTFEEGTQVNKSKILANNFDWEITAFEGCDTIVEELFVICNGWRWKIGQYRFKTIKQEEKIIDDSEEYED